MDLRLAAAFSRLNLLDRSGLIVTGVENITSARTSESLVALAGLTDESNDDPKALFTQSLAELSLPVPDEETTGRMVAKHYAQMILSGGLTAYEGARRIWWDVCLNVQGIRELDVFVCAASEIEDLPDRYKDSPNIANEHILLFEEKIREAAAKLVDSVN